MIENQYIYLTMADSDMDFILIKNYLNANGIPVIAKEKGFGGPIRSIFMGNFMPAHIEVMVRESDHEEALRLLDYEEFNADLDEDFEIDYDDENNDNNNKKKPN